VARALARAESAVLLAMAHVLVREQLYDRDFVRKWVNWDEYLRAERPELPVTFEAFDQALDELYAGSPRSSPRPRAVSLPQP
jgi:anaerobic selenocysteine-containing dehydrogenase